MDVSEPATISTNPKTKRQIPDGEEPGLIESTFLLLEKGETKIELSEEYNDAILVMGNTGGGKSTFTQWIAGDNSKLIAREVQKDTGEYLIDDYNRIGNTTLKSKTVFPELVIDPATNTAYYDCPGFSDTRSTSNDIATTYFIKKVIDHCESIKIMFIISYPSVRKGVDRQDFMKLLRHATDLVKDIAKFENSIAVVVTKVDNQYFRHGDSFTLVDDDKVITSIADFLLEAKEYLKEQERLPNVSQQKKRFYQNAIKFVDVLLTKNHKKYPKIGIFRRPDRPGPLTNISLLQEGKTHIEKIINEELSFTAKRDNDFGYTISETSKLDINDLVEEINKNMWSSITNIVDEALDFYHDVVNKIRYKINSFISGATVIDTDPLEIQEYSHKFNEGRSLIAELVGKMESLANPEELVRIIKNEMVTKLGINIAEEIIVFISKQGKYFNFLQIVSDEKLSSRPWGEPFKSVTTYLSWSEKNIQDDVDKAADAIKRQLQLMITDTVLTIRDNYRAKFKLIEIQKLPDLLQNDHRVMSNMTEAVRINFTIEELVDIIQNSLKRMIIYRPNQNLRSLSNAGRYLRCLQILSDKELDVRPVMLIVPFYEVTEFLSESWKWYRFLGNMYAKFSEYDVQKHKRSFYVAPEYGYKELQKVTKESLGAFFSKIKKYNISEYDFVKGRTLEEFQIQELNHVLNSTVGLHVDLECSEDSVYLKANFVIAREIRYSFFSGNDLSRTCRTFIYSKRFKFVYVLALDTLFIDDDVSFPGNGLQVVFIAPKWEIVGTRRINLNGATGRRHDSYKARDANRYGQDGGQGLPGNPGSPGGIFYGIGETFINGANLTITANGGKGGMGQDAGFGYPGVFGRNAVLPSASDSPSHADLVRGVTSINGFECERITGSYYSNCEDLLGLWSLSFTMKCKSRVDYKIYGATGGKGGDDGNGGKGGRGGPAGSITIFHLNSLSGISEQTIPGKEGEDGEGAAAGHGGISGEDIIARAHMIVPLLPLKATAYTEWELIEKINTPISRLGPRGKEGVDGGNAPQTEISVEVRDTKMPSKILNTYKSYARENLVDNFKRQSMTKFLSLLDSNSGVKSVYDTVGLVNELEGLEEQFYALNQELDFVPIYQSLLIRIGEYAGKRKEGESSNQYVKVLSYLYTAVAGRIFGLKHEPESSLVVNVTEYLDAVRHDVQILQNLHISNNKAAVIRNFKTDFKNRIDSKITEATGFIQEFIIPEISNLGIQIDQKISLLISQIQKLQRDVKEEKAALEQKKRELRKTLELRAVFSCFKILASAVSFLGPIGAAAGAIVGSATSIVESLVLDNRRQTLQIPSAIASNLRNLDNQIKLFRNKKRADFNVLLNKVSQEIGKHSDHLSDVSSKVSDIKRRLNGMTGQKDDYRKIRLLESELARELKKKERQLKEQRFDTDNKISKALTVVGKLNQMVQFGSTMIDIYNKHQNDKASVDLLSDAIDQAGNNLQKLKQYEELIYTSLSPMLRNMQDGLQEVSNNLGGKSQVALDVTKWKVQGTLKDMKLKVQQITEGFEVKDDLARCIEKLEEAMVTQINIYDRIQNYEDQQYFTKLIADISSATANSIHITDPKLASEVDLVRLEMLIRSNIVLKEYKIALDAFKQWVFPFAHHYVDESMIPSHLQLDGDVANLVSNAVRQLEILLSKLRLYKTAVVKSDEYIRTDEFYHRHVSSGPFFVWENEQYQNVISRLLSGQEVVLKADIKKSAANKDAIKFRTIEFHFKSDNETVQSQVNEALKKFDITATHMGNSYYRYNNKTYVITSPKTPIFYSFEQNNAGEPVRKDGVYKKLKDGDLLLSPYAVWKIQLHKATETSSYRDLEVFRGKVDLELEGNGSYVDKDVGCVDDEYQILEELGVNEEIHTYNLPNFRHVDILNHDESKIGYATSGVEPTLSSPINYVCNLVKMYTTSIIMSSLNQISMISSGMSSLSRNNANRIEIDEKSSIIMISLHQMSRIDREIPRLNRNNVNRIEIEEKSSIIKSSLNQISRIDRETSKLRINNVNPIEIDEISIIKASLYQISMIDREISRLNKNNANHIEIGEKSSIIKSSLNQMSRIDREIPRFNRNNVNRIEIDEKSPEIEKYNMLRKPMTTLNVNFKNVDQNTVTNNSTIENQTTTNSSISFKKDNAINDPVLVDAFSDYYNNHSNLFFLSEKEVTFNKKMIESLDLNYSLLLADLITRSLTKNKYKSSIDESLLSPQEVILKKIDNGFVRSEDDIKQNFHSLLMSMQGDRKSSWFSAFKEYFKPVFQFFGLVEIENTDYFLPDIRHLFVDRNSHSILI